MMQDAIERLFSFVPRGSMSALTGVEVTVTLSGLDLVALIQSLKSGYEGFQDYCATTMLAAVVQDDWEAIEGRRAYWAFGQDHFRSLAGRLLEEADRLGMTGEAIEEWLEGLVRKVDQ